VLVLRRIALVDFGCGMPRIGSVIVQMGVYRRPAMTVCVHVPCEHRCAARRRNVQLIVSLNALAVRMTMHRKRRLVGMLVIAVCGVNGDGKRMRFGDYFERLPVSPAIRALEAPVLAVFAKRLEPNAIA